MVLHLRSLDPVVRICLKDLGYQVQAGRGHFDTVAGESVLAIEDALHHLGLDYIWLGWILHAVAKHLIRHRRRS